MITVGNSYYNSERLLTDNLKGLQVRVNGLHLKSLQQLILFYLQSTLPINQLKFLC